MRRNPAAQGARDANQAAIVKRYEELYCSVLDLGGHGYGVPDILLGFAGYTGLREIKTEDGKVRPSQRVFADSWRGGKVLIIRTVADVDADVLGIRAKIARGIFAE